MLESHAMVPSILLQTVLSRHHTSLLFQLVEISDPSAHSYANLRLVSVLFPSLPMTNSLWPFLLTLDVFRVWVCILEDLT
jgi:hypothetical protein